MRPLAWSLFALLLATAFGCPICPDGEMWVVAGNGADVVLAGDELQLEARYGGWKAGASHCGDHWTVDGIEGGDPEHGTVDDCGLYRAPDRFPLTTTEVVIGASQYGEGCADCCPAAGIVLTVVR